MSTLRGFFVQDEPKVDVPRSGLTCYELTCDKLGTGVQGKESERISNRSGRNSDIRRTFNYGEGWTNNCRKGAQCILIHEHFEAIVRSR